MPDVNNPGLDPGQRMALVGRAGSGKTYLSKYFLLGSPQRWVVLDTKGDSNFDDWQPLKGLQAMARLGRQWREKKIVVVRPHSREMASALTLDSYLGELHDSFDNFGTLVDETYQIQLGGKPGPGLTGLVARGRDRKQSVIMGAQRPSWVPLFVFSEANFIASLSLNLPADRDRVYQFTGHNAVLSRLPPRSWFWYDVAADKLRRYAPVAIRP